MIKKTTYRGRPHQKPGRSTKKTAPAYVRSSTFTPVENKPSPEWPKQKLKQQVRRNNPQHDMDGKTRKETRRRLRGQSPVEVETLLSKTKEVVRLAQENNVLREL